MTSTNDSRTQAGRWIEKLLLRGGLLVAAAFLLSALGGWAERKEAVAADSAGAQATTAALTSMGEGLTKKLEMARGELAVVRMQLERAQAVVSYSSRYQIPADLSAAVYDIALSEGIEPALAFRLVQVESNFKRTARSTASAFGYTQIQLPTARHYDRTVTERKLMERDVNLRLGFRYLKDLMEQFDHDSHLALLAYNRGPGRVEQILAEGGNPGNGYSSAILRGARSATPEPRAQRGTSN